MNKRYKMFGPLLLSVLLLLVLVSGCRTHVGLGFGFGHKNSSLKLKVSSTFPGETTDMWAMRGWTLLSEEDQPVTFTFPNEETSGREA